MSDNVLGAPKFQIGEIVIRAYPAGNYYARYNGEFEIVAISTKKQVEESHDLGLLYHDAWYYSLKGGEMPSEFHPHILIAYTSEPYLRKKHLPGEMSFDKLVASLKSVQPVEVTA